MQDVSINVSLGRSNNTFISLEGSNWVPFFLVERVMVQRIWSSLTHSSYLEYNETLPYRSTHKYTHYWTHAYVIKTRVTEQTYQLTLVINIRVTEQTRRITRTINTHVTEQTCQSTRVFNIRVIEHQAWVRHGTHMLIITGYWTHVLHCTRALLSTGVTKHTLHCTRVTEHTCYKYST